MKLKPFFRFFGAKWRSGIHYPEPRYGTIVEAMTRSEKALHCITIAREIVASAGGDPVEAFKMVGAITVEITTMGRRQEVPLPEALRMIAGALKGSIDAAADAIEADPEMQSVFEALSLTLPDEILN